jgi:UDP-N-acetylglucosamine 2-epimerase (non-hydrolysing)
MLGTDPFRIVDEATRLIEDKKAYLRMARPINLYGDGNASPRIASALLGEEVQEWLPEAWISN